MKKIFTLAAASALAAASLSAQAQTVDGVLNTDELTAGKYVLVGKFTEVRGFGDAGFLSLYAASTPTKLYIFLAGTVETNGNSFQLFMDLPAAGGVPAGTALPFGAAGTSFEKMGAKLDLPADLALALRSDAANFKIEAASYTNATTVVSKKLTADTAPLMGDGMALILPVDAAFPALAGARVAYRNATGGKLTANPGNTSPNTGASYGAAGSYGLEIELDRTALGAVTGTPRIDIFAVQNGGDGGYVSSDYIPQRTGPLPVKTPAFPANGNLEGNPDFAIVPGLQAATLNLTATGITLSAKAAREAAALRFGVFPNPGTAVAVNYTVPTGKQDVTLGVFDATGRQVRNLRESQSGSQSYKLNNLRAGIYVVKLSVGSQQTSGKIVIE